MAYACGQTQTSSCRIGQFQIRFELLSRKIEQDKPSWYSFSWLSLTDSNHPLDGNGSIIPSGLPYQTFVSLIGTCGTDSDPLCCKGFLPPSTGGNPLSPMSIQQVYIRKVRVKVLGQLKSHNPQNPIKRMDNNLGILGNMLLDILNILGYSYNEKNLIK